MWQQFAAPWYSGDTSTAVLALINLNTEWNGNDFALDDIALTVRPQISDLIIESDDPEPVPDPGSTLLLLSGGLAGLAGMVKRRGSEKGQLTLAFFDDVAGAGRYRFSPPRSGRNLVSPILGWPQAVGRSNRVNERFTTFSELSEGPDPPCVPHAIMRPCS